jgi:hypothetical protein
MEIIQIKFLKIGRITGDRTDKVDKVPSAPIYGNAAPHRSNNQS